MNTKIALWLSWALFVGFIAGTGYAQVRSTAVMGCVVGQQASATGQSIMPISCSATGSVLTATGT